MGNVAHMQIAGVRERQQPYIGEVNYPYLFAPIEELGFDGWLGWEYRPFRVPSLAERRAACGGCRRVGTAATIFFYALF